MSVETQVLSSCEAGNIDALKSLFDSLNINPSHPKNNWDFPDCIVDNEQRPPAVYTMIRRAAYTQQLSVIQFLFSTFPNCELESALRIAIEAGNLDMVKEICRLDPGAPSRVVEHLGMLHYACGGPERENKFEIASTLLAAGADPNAPPQHTPPWPSASVAAASEMPAKIMEEFFDRGYRCDDPWAVYFAVQYGRKDMVKVLFERGTKLTTARWRPLDELVEAAKESRDPEMEELVRELYPKTRRRKRTGCAVM